MNPRLKVAVIGSGYWGQNLVRNFHELGALAIICDAREDMREMCQQKYPSVEFQNDYRRVLQDPEIGAVALATPAALHYEMAKMAISAGKDVFVEKPLAIKLAEGEELV